jgi:hypothetical protein
MVHSILLGLIGSATTSKAHVVLATRKEEWKAYCLDYFRQAIRSAPGQTENIAAELMEEQAERLFRDFEARGEREVKSKTDTHRQSELVALLLQVE